MLNRCAVVVRPAQPFLDRAAALDDAGTCPIRTPRGRRPTEGYREPY